MDISMYEPVMDCGIPELRASAPVRAAPSLPIAPVLQLPVAAPATRTAVKIVRAKSGLNETRLLKMTADGKPDVFVLENCTLSPLAAQRTELVTGDPARPMSASEAMDAFKASVAIKYPSITTARGQAYSTHLVLL